MIPAIGFLKQLETDFIPPPLLLIFGEEPFYIQKVLHHVHQKLKALGFLPERHQVDASFKWDGFKMALQAGNLFSELKVIELDMPKGNPGKEGTAFIQNWLSDASNHAQVDTILIIRSEKLDTRQLKSAWVQAIDKKAIAVQAKSVDAKALPTWCQQRAQSSDIFLDREAALILSERVEGNLMAADQEIEKLALVFEKGKSITAEDILTQVVDQAHYQLFGLSSAMLLGKTHYALQILKRLEQENEIEPTLILWLFAKEIRTLIMLIEKKQTVSLNQAFQQLRIWKSKEAEYRAAISRHDSKSIKTLFQMALETDLTIKGILREDVWLKLSSWVVRISESQMTDKIRR